MVLQSYKSLLTLLVIGALLAALCPACVAPELTVRKASHPCCPADKDPVPSKSEQCPRARFAMDWNNDAAVKIAKPMPTAELASQSVTHVLPPAAIDSPAARWSSIVPATESLFLLHSILRV